ncbi:MAG: 23S rRNA (pseudouridine(1915)-N(3))-methyltransferase RlmH [Eubacterium sp.]|nr:23S rRNA (pseudouridine(1915)-N(3))-methyltransferase RlmH [Eubacterium sp.]
MKVCILCVGKIKEKFFVDAIKEYTKRLSRYTKLEIVEVNDEKTKENASDRDIEIVQDMEGQRLLRHIDEGDYVVALDIQGKMYDSVQFADKLAKFEMERHKRVIFVIGGSLGICESVLKRANEKISFSKMTFPHQLMRVILLEQIYRGYRIINNEPYHK